MKKILLILCILITNCSIAQVNLNNGLIAKYNFTGNAADSSGYNNHGVVTKAKLTTDRFGRPNSAYFFDADSASHISATIPNLPLGDSNRTLNLWAKWSTKPFINAAHIANWGQRAQGELFGVGVYQNNNWYEFGYDNPNGFDLASGIVADTAWHMITGIYKNHTMMIYIDGALASVRTKTLNTTTSDFMVGTRPDMFSDCFYTGKVDDIRIYNRALNQTEITALTTAPLSTPVLSVSKISIYPIPAGDYLFILNNKYPMDVIVSDLTGKTLINLKNVNDQVSLSGLAIGTYIVKIKDGEDYSVHKITKL